jgi:DNA polymerase-1
LKKIYPDARFVMVWEGSGKSWRHTFWDGYKANRPKEKSDDAKQVLMQETLVKDVCRDLGIPQISVVGLEADDLIGLIAVKLQKEECPVVIYSSDKDFFQLMRYGVKIIRDVKKDRKLAVETDESVEEMFGCCTGDVLMVRAIAGDTSDGIPNPVYGIGPKKAVGYLTSGSWPDSLISNWETVQRNYRLMRIVTSVLSKELTPEQKVLVKEQIATVRSLLEGGYRSGQYGEWVARLGQFNLQEALDDRLVLWRIQD